MGGRLREGVGPVSVLCLPLARHFDDGENKLGERRAGLRASSSQLLFITYVSVMKRRIALTKPMPVAA